MCNNNILLFPILPYIQNVKVNSYQNVYLLILDELFVFD